MSENNSQNITIEELFSLFRAKKQTTARGQKYMPLDEKPEHLIYVLYARKSTTERNPDRNKESENEEDRVHGRSIEDQIAYCEDFVRRNGLDLYPEYVTEEKVRSVQIDDQNSLVLLQN